MDSGTLCFTSKEELSLQAFEWFHSESDQAYANIDIYGHEPSNDWLGLDNSGNWDSNCALLDNVLSDLYPVGDFQSAVSHYSRLDNAEQEVDRDISQPDYELVLDNGAGYPEKRASASFQLSGLVEESIPPEPPPFVFSPHSLTANDCGTIESSCSPRSGLSHECATCGACFSNYAALDRHARDFGSLHFIYVCTHTGCASRYNRRDTFLRHLGTHTNTPRFPCPHCHKHDGEKAFIRRDHLRQHIRCFHNISLAAMNADFAFCPHPSCEFSSFYASNHLGRRAFESRKEYTRHMRNEHGESTYQCDVPGCERMGRKGYARRSDLKKHKRMKHFITNISDENPNL